MARTNLSDVQDAIDTDLTDDQVNGFIDDANLWVTEELVGQGLSSDRLKLIEKYLACHFVTLRDPRLRQAAIDDVRETYQRDTEVTEYLKSAAMLDPTGTIQARLIDGKTTVKWKVGAGLEP